MTEKTIFQKIIDREIPAPLVYEDDLVAAFNDIQPQAPIHVLIVPKKLIPRVGEAQPEDQATLGALLLAAGKIADSSSIMEKMLEKASRTYTSTCSLAARLIGLRVDF